MVGLILFFLEGLGLDAAEGANHGGADAGAEKEVVLGLSMIVPVGGGLIVLGFVSSAVSAGECMRALFRSLYEVGDSRGTRRDCGLVIRSRGRWGKCG